MKKTKSLLLCIGVALMVASMSASATTWMEYQPIGGGWVAVYQCSDGAANSVVCEDTGRRILGMPDV